MGKLYQVIDARLAEFIRAQRIFFVATAPLAAGGHVNVSPKGLESLRILDEKAVAYLDLVGSGAETIAHLRENGRIVLMFCAFEGSPKIVRLHGRGTPLEPSDPGFDALAARFPPHPGTRAIIRVDCERISDSCGFGVPRLDFRAERTQLTDWARRKGSDGLRSYQREHNRRSLDGLPALVGSLDGGEGHDG